MKNNISIAKLYSDLEKYESNLHGVKDTRLKRQSSGASLSQAYNRPPSTKKYKDVDSYGASSLTRFEKSRLEVNYYKKRREDGVPFGDNNRSSLHDNSRELRYEFKHNSFLHNDTLQKSYLKDHLIKESLKESREQKVEPVREKENSPPPSSMYSKKHELYFLNQCNQLYNLNSSCEKKALTPQEESESVKVLLSEINKRDRLYEAVTKRVGSVDVQTKLLQFFEKFDRMEKIIDEFKKMSKLSIDDDKELYEFLIQDDAPEIPQKNEEQASESNLMETEA